MVPIRQAKKDDLIVWLEMRRQLWPSNTEESHQNEMLESISDKNFVAFWLKMMANPLGFWKPSSGHSQMVVKAALSLFLKEVGSPYRTENKAFQN